jgi:putative membrane protein
MQGEKMQKSKAIRTALVAMVAVASLGFGLIVHAAEPASEADKVFVGKVSQGGLYEVEAGKVAAMHATTPVVKNFGVLESHDHEGVNAALKHIAGMTGVTITPGLNDEFSQRLAKLKAVPAAQFDAFYVDDMKQIHNKDEGLFVQEAQEGSAAYKDFAHRTAVLVNAHLGWLNTL